MNKNKGLLWFVIYGNILSLIIWILQSIYDFYFGSGTFWFYIKAGITLVIVVLIVLGILQFKKMLRNKYRGSWRLWLKTIFD